MWCIQEFVCYVYTSENRKKMTRYFAPNLTSNSRLFAARQQSPLSKYHMICWQDQSTSKWAVKMLQIDCSLFSRLLFQQQQKSNLWNMDIVVFPAAGTGFNHQRSYDMLVFINTWILWGNFMLLTCVLTHYLPASTHVSSDQPRRLWVITIRKLYARDSIHGWFDCRNTFPPTGSPKHFIFTAVKNAICDS